MAFWNLFRKNKNREQQEPYELKKIPEEDIEKAKSLIEEYHAFYNAHKEENLCFHHLLSPEETTSYHNVALNEAILYEFPFKGACVLDGKMRPKQKEEIISLTAYGNIPIGMEGCQMYWILILSGPYAGEVWLLTDCGIAPVAEHLTLDKWYQKKQQNGPPFWFDTLSKWGRKKDDFFYSHAPIKMVFAKQHVFGCSSPLCITCVNGIGKYAKHHKVPVVVSDPLGTYIFGSLPPEDGAEEWKYYNWSNGVSYYYHPNPYQ